jgi:hypothetical protein
MFDGGAVHAYRELTVVKKTAIEVLSAAGLVLFVCQSAAAQARVWEDRVMVGVSFGMQASSEDINSSSTFPIYGEQGTVESQSSFGSGPIFDVTVGVRVWRNVGIAGAFHAFSETGSGSVEGTVPHPLFFDRPRSFSQSVGDLERKENVGHLMFGWMVPVSDRFDVFVYAGPSFFRLKQDVVDSVDVPSEQPPFTSVTVAPHVTTYQESTTGYNVGFDAAYFFNDSDSARFGVGGFFRYTGAVGHFGPEPEGSISTDAGGPQFGIGARLRF